MNNDKIEFRAPKALKVRAMKRASAAGISKPDFLRCALANFLDRYPNAKEAQAACLAQRLKEVT